MSQRPAQAADRDVSHLPTHAFGTANPLWWGNLAYMVIEGLGFVFAIASYFYLFNENNSWPLGPQPGLTIPTWGLVLVLISEIPNVWLKKAATKIDLKKVRFGLIVMSLFGIGAIALRSYEFGTLHIRWDDNAYGSITWFLLGIHSLHLLTDVGETIVMTVLMHVGPVDMRRYPEIEDNQDYWHFVVIFWVIIYLILYWVPRWFEVPA